LYAATIWRIYIFTLFLFARWQHILLWVLANLNDVINIEFDNL